MIFTIVRNGFRALRRDRGAFILSFILPVAFFTIFGVVFGGMRPTGTPRVSVLVVDEDHSPASERLVRGLRREPSLQVSTHPEGRKGEPEPADYTAETAEASVRQGVAPAALVIPKGFGENPVAPGPGGDRRPVTILHDPSDPVAAQMLSFLLFTASGAAGSLLDEAESGALDRMLSARVTMTTLLAGKMTYCTLLACAQLTIMFLWAAAVFHLDLFTHVPGFLVMTVATAFAAASFGMLLASVSHTRAQQAAIGTLIILTMSAVGGSMFPRFLMPEAMRKIGLLTFNAWAIDGYTRVFWRDEPVSHLGPQVAALVGSGIVLFLIARRFARRWEHA